MHRAAAAVLATVTLAACASAASGEDPAMRTMGFGAPTWVRHGDTVRLPDDGGSLRYVGVVQDSRCPPDVQCIRAGDADIAFEWSAGGAGAQKTIKFPDAPAWDGPGSWRLTVLDLEFNPSPSVQVRIDPKP